MKTKRLLVAGGGTGGHVLAGIAVADAWKKQFGEDAQVLFVGASQGLEARLVPKNGYDLKLLKIGALNQVTLKTRVRTMIQLPLSFIRAFAILISYRPTAVIGVGGYASGPVVMLSRILSFFLRTKTAILEQNSVTGFTNRVLGKWVHQVYCAFDDAKKSFAPEKVEITGNPIRSYLQPLPPSTQNPFTLFIFGGSQGAMGMNTMVIDALPYLKGSGIHFIHQTGIKDFERVAQAYHREGLLQDHAAGPTGGAIHHTSSHSVRVEKFIDEMGSCYAAASLVICRAGASSMGELASVGRAAIFVPLPTAADNHQEKNARIYEQAGAAIVIPQASLTGAQFAERVLALKNNPALIHAMETKVQPFYRSDAAASIVRELSKGIS